MKSNGVQFRGEEQVLKAYEMNDMAPWSLWQGQNMPFVSEEESMSAGAEYLQQAMSMLKEGGSEATYTLRVYKTVPAGGIRNNTPFDRSFNFSIYNPGSVGSPFQQRQSAVIGLMNTRFDEMQAAFMGRVFDKLDKEDEEEEAESRKGPGGIVGVINGLLENPQIKEVLMSKVADFVGNLLGTNKQVGAIGALPDRNNAVGLHLEQDQIEKINEAIAILAANDPKIGDHLLKLAALSRDNPSKYKMGLSML
jgi:hypothetical protein